MSKTTDVLRFTTALLPAIRDLIKVLFQKHGGDVEAAKKDIARIPDYGEQLRNFEAEIDRRMAELRAAEARAGKAGG